MSNYTDASLIMYPSGYKEDKIYSLKPTDGSGDLTFTRASTATRVNSDGLIEKARTNLNTYSQNFTATGGWAALFGATITRTENYGTAPDGTTTSTRIVFSGGSQIYSKTISGLTGNIGVFSLWIKGTAGQTIAITYGGASDKLVTLGSGWTRFNTNGNSASNNTIYINTFISATARDIEVWGGQVELGDIATDYIPTTTTAVSVGMTADVPRIDYTGGGCGKLLLEPQRTNSILYSEEFDNAVWGKSNITITANAATSPDGYQNAEKIISDTSSGSHILFQSVSASISLGTTYTYSFFAKAAEYTKAGIRIGGTGYAPQPMAAINLSTGAIISQQGFTSVSVVSYGNGWYRIAGTYVATSADANSNIIPLSDSFATSSFNYTFTGDGTSGILAFGAMHEAGSYVSSYVKTLASSVTRLADAAYKTGISSLIGQTEGVIFWDLQVETLSASGNENILNIDNGGFGTTIYMIKGATGGITAEVYVGSTAQCTFTYSLPSVGRYKIALGYKTNDFAFYVNGVLIGTDSSGSVPATSRLQMGNGALGPSDGQINSAILFPTRLTNTQLAELTTI